MVTLAKPQERLYRILFHILIVAFFFLIPALYGPERINPPNVPAQDFWQGRFLMRMMSIPLYFINVFILIPRFLIRGKYGWYAVSVLACSLITVIIQETFMRNMLITEIGPMGRQLVDTIPGRGSFIVKDHNPLMFPIPMILPMIFHLAIGTSFEMVFYWQAQKKEREKIEKDKIFTELSFLKSQINPHFLFNSLNNIYSLAEKKSDKTGEAVLMLSQLMRYMLYDSNNGKIALHKEIQYLKNYINIQRLRIPSEENIRVNFNVIGDDTGILVEPLIFIAFIENAFKHGMSYTQKSTIDITLTINRAENKLVLYIFNTKKSLTQESVGPETQYGIGLANSKRRLEILYPQTHELDITDHLDLFEVRLTLYYQ